MAEMTMVAQNRPLNDSIMTESNERSTSLMMKALMTNVKSPKVRIIIGRETSFRIGFTSVFRSAKTNPASTYC